MAIHGDRLDAHVADGLDELPVDVGDAQRLLLEPRSLDRRADRFLLGRAGTP